MLTKYNKCIELYPLLTKCTTSGVIFSIGDFITQKFLEKQQQINYSRNFNLFTVGALYIAPSLHLWYCKGLTHIAKLYFANSSKTVRVFGSMILDQLVFAPVFLSGFFVVNSFVNSPTIQGLKTGIHKLRIKIWQTLKANWKIWPIATSINFWFIPVQYQVLYANILGLFWNIILSYITYN